MVVLCVACETNTKVFLIQIGTMPGKVWIHVWEKEQFPWITMAHFMAVKLTMVLCALSGIAAASCYEQQSDSFDLGGRVK